MENENKEIVYRLVGYTDGAAKPSRGNWGSGYFGYLYDIETVGKASKNLPKEITPTTHGFTCPELYQENPEFFKAAKDVQPSKYIIGSLPGEEISTNNYAEAYALLSLFRQVASLKLNISHMLIFMDSQMLIYVVQELLNNPSPAFDRYAFPDLYAEMHLIITTLTKKNMKIVVKHTYGHSFSFGNNIADRLAYMGRLCCQDTVSGDNPNKYSYEEIIDCNPERDDFWTKTQISSYIYGRNLYFSCDHMRGETPYYVLEYKGDDEVGEKNGDILMGSIYTDRGDDLIETIINRHLHTLPDNGIVFTVELPNTKHHLSTFFSKVSPHYYLTKDNKPSHLTVVEEFTICRTLRPGSLAVQLLNKFDLHKIILSAYENPSEGSMITFIDLTSQLFNKIEKKGKIKHECLVGIKSIALVLEYEGNEYPFEYRTDIPERNYLKKFETATDIKAAMAFRRITDSAVDYYFILYATLENGEVYRSIWNNFYSNKLYIQKDKK